MHRYRVVAAVTPLDSEEERRSACASARQAANEAPWLGRVLDHHQQIEAAFAAVKDAGDGNGRRRAQKWLGTLLTGHSLAEEAVLYPAMALGDQKSHSTAAYSEQSGAKINLAALETLDPMSQEYLDKLEHVRGAVAHHVYEEESKWFPALACEGGAALQMRLSARYTEEFVLHGCRRSRPLSARRCPRADSCRVWADLRPAILSRCHARDG